MSENIQENCHVLLRRKSNLKLMKLSSLSAAQKEWQAQLGKDTVDIRDVIGHRFGSFFKLNHEKGRNFKAVYTESITELVDSVLEGIESGEDNRTQWDDGSSQKMSNQEVNKLRKEGMSASDLVKQLVENNKSFQQKTGFSQEKYVKKKEEKYFEYMEVLRPTIRLITQMLYSQNPLKILNLRLDMLSQILSRANVMAGGRYMVFENNCQGLITAAVLERVGETGAVYQVHAGTTAPTNCIDSLNFSDATRTALKSISITHLKKLMHPPTPVKNGDSVPDPTFTAPLNEKEELASEETKAGDKRKIGEGANQTAFKKPKMSSRSWDEASAAWSEISRTPLDGLVIVTRQPEPIVLHLLKLLAPSRCFAVFSPHLEPLTNCYTAIKSSGIALNLRLSETWLRHCQVLPGRTHPEINMSGGGGYLLCGTTCLSSR